MKKYSIFLSIIFAFGFIVTSEASLTTDSNYVYDDVTNIWWWKDLSTFVFSGNTYSAQLDYISNLPGNWNIAGQEQIQGLWANGGTLIANNFSPSSANLGFWGRTDIVDIVNLEYGHSVGWIGIDGSDHGYDIHQADGSTGNHIGAWVYTETNPVPIPSAVWLLGTGLIGIVGIRRKIKK